MQAHSNKKSPIKMDGRRRYETVTVDAELAWRPSKSMERDRRQNSKQNPQPVLPTLAQSYKSRYQQGPMECKFAFIHLTTLRRGSFLDKAREWIQYCVGINSFWSTEKNRHPVSVSMETTPKIQSSWVELWGSESFGWTCKKFTSWQNFWCLLDAGGVRTHEKMQ